MTDFFKSPLNQINVEVFDSPLLHLMIASSGSAKRGFTKRASASSLLEGASEALVKKPCDCMAA
jgi:hypothetical protein